MRGFNFNLQRALEVRKLKDRAVSKHPSDPPHVFQRLISEIRIQLLRL